MLKIGLNQDLEVKLEVEVTAGRRINKMILIEQRENTKTGWELI